MAGLNGGGVGVVLKVHVQCEIKVDPLFLHVTEQDIQVQMELGLAPTLKQFMFCFPLSRNFQER